MQPLSYAVELTQKLIRCPSVTPAEGGALDLLEAKLADLGFTCTRLPFGDGDERIENLYARIGTEGPHFAFAGHTDVVPPGNTASWRHDAFSGTIEEGLIYGRGAADMKGGIAAFVAACKSYLATEKLNGSISLIITGDEEAAAINGTVKMVEWLEASGNVPDFCVVGEPTNPSVIGEVIKNGRRGSLTCALAVKGSQGHVAYPHLANNPVPALCEMLAPVNSTELDGGTAFFDPSTAQVTALNIADPASNVIPNSVTAQFNIRFNTEHTADSLTGWLEEHFERIAEKAAVRFDATFVSNAAPFITEPGPFTALLSDAILSQTGTTPSLSTTGGTSDARFICKICPVAEFGLVGRTMHKIDEHVATDDIETLASIYHDILVRALSLQEGS